MKPTSSNTLTRILQLILVGSGLALLFYLGRNDYLLFHSFAELFSIGVAYSLMILAWNTRRFHENSFLLFTALALLFTSNLDLVHTLSYKGMGLLPLPDNANIATQLWIAARYMQAISLLIAPLFFRRKVRVGWIISVLAIVELIIFASILWWKIFPVCYIDGIGQTTFKIASEYVIIGIYIAALIHFRQRKPDIQPRIYTYMTAMMVVSILTEAAFTGYIGVFDFANWLGHILKILSFYLVYKAIVETGLEQPVELLFHNLQESQAALEKSHQELENRVNERTAELEAQVIERRKAEEKIAAHADRSEALAEVSRLMIATRPGDEPPLEAIANTLIGCIGDGCVIRLLSDDQCYLQAVVVRHVDSQKQEGMEAIFRDLDIVPGVDMIGQIFTQGRAELYTHFPIDNFVISYGEQRGQLVRELGLDSIIIAPMQEREEKIGSITLFRNKFHPAYSQEDLILVEAVAGRMALSVSNARLYESLQKALAEEQNMRDRLIQSEKHSAISRMIASIAHELNNPVQTIQNCLYLFKRHIQSDEKLETYLSMASNETDRIANLVSQLREVYRPRRDRPREAIVVDSLLTEVHNLLEPHLAHNHVDWVDVCECGPGAPLFQISAIHDEMKQVFINLCLNGIEAMQPEGGALYLDKQISSDGMMVGISVLDSGPGIPAETLSKIFEPFYTTKDSGNGLGLAVTYEIVVRHGGSILADSQPGRGAKFTVWLPLVEEMELEVP